MPTASSIQFIDANYFSGDLTLNSTGSITQKSGAGNTLSITGGGKLIVNDSSEITLNNSGNVLGRIGPLSSGGAIAIKTSAGMTLTGNIDAVGPIGLSALGVSIADSITVSGGDLSLTAGTGAVTQAAGKTLTLTDGKLIVLSSSGITLGNSGNSIETLGALKSDGAITIATTTNLTVTGDIDASTTAGSTINLTATGMYLTSAIRSTSGGAVTIALGKGTYNNLNGMAATTPGLTWTTGNRDVELNLGLIESGTGSLFDVGTGKLRTNYVRKPGFESKNIFVSGFWSPEEKERIRAEEKDAEFHTLTELSDGIEAGRFESAEMKDAQGVFYQGSVVFKSNARSYPNPDSTITFMNIRGGSVDVKTDFKPTQDRKTFNGTLRFAGVQNHFTSFDFATTDSATMVVKANSTLRGEISVGAGGIQFENGARLGSGSLKTGEGVDLSLNFQADYIQGSSDAKFSAGQRLIIKTNGNSVRLMNRENGFTKLTVTTDGGNFMIASKESLKFDRPFDRRRLGGVWMTGGAD